jgi:hypothetical protein|nr:MAG TPA: hypothetical protein [Caudoviricetes sp.]
MFDLNDALASNGGKTLKPETIGETLGGVITATEVRQVNNFSTGKPDFWDDGKPKNQIVITVKTGGTTEDGEDEQGNIYVKTWGEQKQALIAAIKASGLADANTALAPGNRFTVTFKGEKPSDNPRFNAVKIYEYKIVPQANVGGVLEDTPSPQQAAPQPVESTATTPAQTARKLIASGLDDQTIATATGLDPAVIAALRAA